MSNEEEKSISIYDGTFDLSILPKFPRELKDRKLVDMMFESIFEVALDAIASGQAVSSIIRNDPRGMDYARFLRWILRDKVRTARYEEAQKIFAEMLVSEMAPIADGESRLGETPTTAERDKIKLETRRWLAAKFNKKKFGDSKHIDVTSSDDPDAMKKLTVEELEKIASGEEGE